MIAIKMIEDDNTTAAAKEEEAYGCYRDNRRRQHNVSVAFMVNDDGTLLFHFDNNKATTDIEKEITFVATDRLAVAATVTIVAPRQGGILLTMIRPQSIILIVRGR